MLGNRDFRPGKVIAGTKYRVISVIGVGGMGTVYAVEHIELKRRFVLKALLRELANRDELVLRLRNEWRALGKLEHPNIVTVTDAGVSQRDKLPYYVMQHLEGETLAQRLARKRSLSVPEALEICEGIVDGLGAAHRIGIVHRDVKPPNIFIPERAPVKLLDFGIAKAHDADVASITQKGIAIGTPRYMSPEQAAGNPLDGRADLYAVGLLLFEMVVGRGPFHPLKDPSELLMAQLQVTPPRLADVAPGVAPELSDLVEALLQKSPDARPATADQVSEAVRQLARRYQSHGSSTGPTPLAPYQAATQPLNVKQVHGTRPDGLAAKQPAGPSRSSTAKFSPTGTLIVVEGAPAPHGDEESHEDAESQEHAEPHEDEEHTAVGDDADQQPTHTQLELDQSDTLRDESVPFASTPPPVERAARSKRVHAPPWLGPATLAATLLLVAVGLGLQKLSHTETDDGPPPESAPAQARPTTPDPEPPPKASQPPPAEAEKAADAAPPASALSKKVSAPTTLAPRDEPAMHGEPKKARAEPSPPVATQAAATPERAPKKASKKQPTRPTDMPNSGL